MDITVTGNEHYDRFNIRRKLPSLQPGVLIYEPTFVKELGTLNGNPDLKVAPVLKPGTEPGTVDLELKVKDRLPVHGKLEADNRGPITTPQNRLDRGSSTYQSFRRRRNSHGQYGPNADRLGRSPELRSKFRLSGEMARSSAGCLRIQIAKQFGLGWVGHFSRRREAISRLPATRSSQGFAIFSRSFPEEQNTHQLSVGVDYKQLRANERHISRRWDGSGVGCSSSMPRPQWPIPVSIRID